MGYPHDELETAIWLGLWSNSNTLGATATPAAVTIRIVGTALRGRVNVAVNHRAAPAQVLSAQEVLGLNKNWGVHPGKMVGFMGI